ncbi:hypothetical protein CDAR_408581 [Caerostris darwini]|uniref:Uncharacterized protein n=1 Tax=Caerostris darwini TaxID=1538125 RepID=A0AAV4X4I9_9ARAC|nr:hypothetical protein CDAR_408581 [Caerostris darwini]
MKGSVKKKKKKEKNKALFRPFLINGTRCWGIGASERRNSPNLNVILSVSSSTFTYSVRVALHVGRCPFAAAASEMDIRCLCALVALFFPRTTGTPIPTPSSLAPASICVRKNNTTAQS